MCIVFLVLALALLPFALKGIASMLEKESMVEKQVQSNKKYNLATESVRDNLGLAVVYITTESHGEICKSFTGHYDHSYHSYVELYNPGKICSYPIKAEDEAKQWLYKLNEGKNIVVDDSGIVYFNIVPIKAEIEVLTDDEFEKDYEVYVVREVEQ